MGIYPTPNVGVNTDDVVAGVSGDTGTNGLSDLTNIWRVRAQAAAGGGAANGWSSQAPIGTQGAVFAESTVGFTAINVSFDWYATNRGESNMQLEYTTDGTTFHNIPIVIPAADATTLTLVNNSADTDTNSVAGFYVSIQPNHQNWYQGLTAIITDPLAMNNPNFAIEMVNASTGASDVDTEDSPLNNSSGNWRFDNVTINGTAVPEPASAASLGLAGLGVLAKRNNRKRA